jgi:XTP/dITP diphosphohydrolase
MARLVLVDTADQLPGLLPLHAWSALMASDLVLVGAEDHPFLPHLREADLRVDAVPAGDLQSRADAIVARVHDAGEVAYLFGRADTEAFTRTLGLEAARAGVEIEVVYFLAAPKGVEVLDLVAVEERLRGPGGCPWDREQTHASLAHYAVEEVYELLEAIEADAPEAICEELGDVLLQVVFHAQMAQDAGTFTIDDVARGISEKLVRRHPHVFGDAVVADADEVMANWDQLKAAEKPERAGVFDGIPPGQPAMAYVEKLQRRAAKTGFDWDADVEAADRIRLELDEFLAAGDDEARAAELGDLLMSVIGLARRSGIDPELALRGAARRFRTRFQTMAAAAGRPLDELSRAEWLDLWETAKGSSPA